MTKDKPSVGFWEDMVEEYVTLPGGWCVPKDQVYEGFGYARGEPDRSRFDNGKVIVGEIVEDERALPART